MKVNRKKIDNAILDIKKMQMKYCKVETMFIYHCLDKALNSIGWTYAELLEMETGAPGAGGVGKQTSDVSADADV
jgi:hypothetical protein